MTWEELCVKAKEMGADVEIFGEFISRDDVFFWKNGEVNILGSVIAKNRTTEQMYQIMKALR